MHRQRLFLFLMSLAAAAATSALGQTVAPTVGPASTQGAMYIPDFSGRWSHPYWPGFEPPASGPGPVTNRLRVRRGPQKGVSNPNQLVGDYTNPILKPWAAEIVKQHGEAELNGLGSPTPLNQCWPEGVPFVFRDIGMQMLQQRDRIIILYVLDQQFRHVRMNQPHPTLVTPSWYGDSVGHYEGDTLVIDTVGSRSGIWPWSICSARHIPKPCTLLNDIGYSITKPRKKAWNGPRGKIIGFRPTRFISTATPTIEASICNSNLRSRMRASSRRPGRRP